MVRFDAYIASDFMWAPLLRDTARIQIFHGVGGKYGFDAPDRSMREWHRLFFVNERRLRNFIARGAIDADSPAIRLVGMPKVDCLVDGTFQREHVLQALGLDPSRPTVLYAPTWSPASSLNAMGVELVEALGRMPVNVIMKLHDRSRDLRERYSGGVDWAARLQPLLAPGKGALAPGHDISPYLVAADVMITDHSSAGFEYPAPRPAAGPHPPAAADRAGERPPGLRLAAGVGVALGRRPAGSARRRRTGAGRSRRPERASAAAWPPTCSTGPAARRHARCASCTTSSSWRPPPAVSGRAAPARGRGAMATVSVIMPAFNVAPYIGAAIESVLAQTLPDWELLIVDDGSTDSTVEIGPAPGPTRDARDPAAAAGRTAGSPRRATRRSRAATGEFIAILDSDDLWEPTLPRGAAGVFAPHPGRRHRHRQRLVPRRPAARPAGAARCPTPGRSRRCTTILADETADLHHVGLPPPRVRNDRRLRRDAAQQRGLRLLAARRRSPASRFWRNDRPLGHYRRRDDSVSASDVSMLAGILRVYRKLRPLLHGPAGGARASLDAQIARFERERSRRMRAIALTTGDIGQRGRSISRRSTRSGGGAGHRRGQLHGAAHAAAAGPRLSAAPRLLTERRDDASGGLGRSLARRIALGLRRVDHAVGRLAGRRPILVEARTPMNLAVLRPVLEPLLADPADPRCSSPDRDRADLRAAFNELGVSGTRHRPRAAPPGRRFDLYINADPVGGRVASPRRPAAQFLPWRGRQVQPRLPGRSAARIRALRRVAFPNAGAATPTSPPASSRRDRAVLIGYPKTDALVNGRGNPRGRRRRSASTPSRPTVIFAPTFSPASALNHAGEAIIQALLADRLQRHREAARSLARSRSALHRRRQLARRGSTATPGRISCSRRAAIRRRSCSPAT